jgi:hypothetical protein
MSLYYIYKLSNDKLTEYFFTKIHVSKAIYALKNSKKPSNIKTILQGNYKCNLVTAYNNVTRQFVKKELQLFYEHESNRILNINKHLEAKNIRNIHNNTKASSLLYGLSRQKYNFNLLNETIFNNKLYEARNEHSEFDFYHLDSHTLIELKCLTYSINKYTTAIINTNKLIYNKYIFIFEYMDDDKPSLYFHHYDPSREYNKRTIIPKNRINPCEIIDIPVRELRLITELYSNTNLDLDFYTTIGDRVKFSELIFIDKTYYDA